MRAILHAKFGGHLAKPSPTSDRAPRTSLSPQLHASSVDEFEAALTIVSFTTPALAEQFYVAFDPASHKCEMMHSQPTGTMKSMGGPFKTEAEAKKAMGGMKECQS